MNQKMKTWVAVIAMSFVTLCSFSQEVEEEQSIAIKNPRWVSDKGYWVIESNVNTPMNHTIWFYNNDNILIYKESLAGIKLNPAKRKVRMKLKKVLETSVVAWEQKKVPEENKEYVAAILR